MLTTGILDPERETSLDEVFATLELPVRRFEAELGTGRSAEVIDLGVNGVRVTLMPTVSSRAERSPDPRESAIFLELADQVFDRFRPDVLLTYGGHPASLELMRRARQRGIAVVFHLHNFGYNDGRAFADASAVMFPSQYSAATMPGCWVRTVRSSRTRSRSIASSRRTPSRNTSRSSTPSRPRAWPSSRGSPWC